METIEYLLKNVLKGIAVILILILLIMGVNKFAPGFWNKFSFSSGGAFFTDNWLPDPVNMQSYASGTTADLRGNELKGGMSPGTAYVVYTKSGMHIVNSQPTTPFNPQTSGYADSSLFVRNLTIFQGQGITTRQMIYGEARNTFFANGRFPVYILDMQGRVFAQEWAYSTGQWSIPGWSRFVVQIHSLLPSQQQCQMLFAPDPASQDAGTYNRAQLSVICN